MSQADAIREFALDQIVVPARLGGQTSVTIRAGDLHRAMGLSNAMPAVCSVLGGNRFTELAGVRLLERTGPAAGSNVWFTYALDASVAITTPAPEPRSAGIVATIARQPVGRPEFRSALVLVSCVSMKAWSPAPARELYTSPWFCAARAMVEHSGARWLILSALHGLVEPTTPMAPYEKTLLTMSVEERRAWASRVLAALLPLAREKGRVVMLAGARYREFLVAPLRAAGIAVEVPMEGLRLGEQLSWLAARQ